MVHAGDTIVFPGSSHLEFGFAGLRHLFPSIASFSSFQMSDPNLIQVLDESQSRISTMSYIHESLYRNTDFTSINFAEYLDRLSTNLVNSYSTPDCKVNYTQKLDDVNLPLDQAIPCGLIVNELVSNVLKYAFKGRSEGDFYLRVQEEKGVVEVVGNLVARRRSNIF